MTGATGFLGGELARQLRADGHDVVALVRDPAKAGSLTGVELVPGDLDDSAALDALCSGVDGLFHVAGWYKVGVRDGAETAHRANVTGTRNVLAAARRNSVPRVVHTSTVGVNSDTKGRIVDEEYDFDGPYLSHYERTKAEAHRTALQHADDGLDVVVVQPGLIYGPGDTALTGELIAQVVKGKRPQVPSGGGVCWTHVSDVARGHILALERGRTGRTYFLTGPPSTLADGLRMVARIAGTKGPIVVPGAVLVPVARLLDVVGKVVPLPPHYHPESMRSGLASYLGSPARAERELGWSARPMEEGLAATVASLRGAAHQG